MQSGHELETYTPDEWTEDLSIVEGSRKNRKRVVRDLEKSCNLEISAIVGEVKAGRLSPYHVSKKYVDSMRGRLAPLTMQSRRTILAVMWETVLPQTNFSRRAFDRLVPMGATYN